MACLEKSCYGLCGYCSIFPCSVSYATLLNKIVCGVQDNDKNIFFLQQTHQHAKRFSSNIARINTQQWQSTQTCSSVSEFTSPSYASYSGLSRRLRIILLYSKYMCPAKWYPWYIPSIPRELQCFQTSKYFHFYNRLIIKNKNLTGITLYL